VTLLEPCLAPENCCMSLVWLPKDDCVRRSKPGHATSTAAASLQRLDVGMGLRDWSVELGTSEVRQPWGQEVGSWVLTPRACQNNTQGVNTERVPLACTDWSTVLLLCCCRPWSQTPRCWHMRQAASTRYVHCPASTTVYAAARMKCKRCVACWVSQQLLGVALHGQQRVCASQGLRLVDRC
jgi:hypothetical protein